MVNYNPYLDEPHAQQHLSSPSVLFNLSKPIEYLNFAEHTALKLPVKSAHDAATLNYNFTFLEPFESCRAASHKLTLKSVKHQPQQRSTSHLDQDSNTNRYIYHI